MQKIIGKERMRIISSINNSKDRSYLEEVRSAGSSIGLVPTMGFLHEGHASLINASTDQRDVTIVSIYVNPLQFSPDEDFSDYPRDISSDLKLCDKHGTDVVFAPSEEEIKTFSPQHQFILREVTKTFEGEVVQLIFKVSQLS